MLPATVRRSVSRDQMSRLDDLFASQEAPSVKRVTVRRPDGYVSIVGPEGLEMEGDTRQCVHCQMHWRVEVGSGKLRGFCHNCMGPLCGKQKCMTECIPAEKMIEAMERSA